MSEAIIVALITGGLSLLGIIYSSNKTAQAMDSKLDKQQAVMETKMDELTREVREHNNFAKRMPVVEEQIKVINHRIEDLEEYHKGAQSENSVSLVNDLGFFLQSPIIERSL